MNAFSRNEYYQKHKEERIAYAKQRYAKLTPAEKLAKNKVARDGRKALRLLSPTTCRQCGTAFSNRSRNAIYCSRKCKDVFLRANSPNYKKLQKIRTERWEAANPDRVKELRKRSKERNPRQYLARRHRSYEKNKERWNAARRKGPLTMAQIIAFAAPRKLIKQMRAQHRAAIRSLTPEQRRIMKNVQTMAWQAEDCRQLGDTYVRKHIAKELRKKFGFTVVPCGEIPQEMVDAQRSIIRVKRFTKELTV